MTFECLKLRCRFLNAWRQMGTTIAEAMIDEPTQAVVEVAHVTSSARLRVDSEIEDADDELCPFKDVPRSAGAAPS